ncbi:hypothetical protein PSPO01_14850 [Paraphaeosphaeria sporulosa]
MVPRLRDITKSMGGLHFAEDFDRDEEIGTLDTEIDYYNDDQYCDAGEQDWDLHENGGAKVDEETKPSVEYAEILRSVAMSTDATLGTST